MREDSVRGNMKSVFFDALARNDSFPQLFASLHNITGLDLALWYLESGSVVGFPEAFSNELVLLSNSGIVSSPGAKRKLFRLFSSAQRISFKAGEIDASYYLLQPMFSEGALNSVLFIRYSDASEENTAGFLAGLAAKVYGGEVSAERYRGNLFNTGLARIMFSNEETQGSFIDDLLRAYIAESGSVRGPYLVAELRAGSGTFSSKELQELHSFSRSFSPKALMSFKKDCIQILACEMNTGSANLLKKKIELQSDFSDYMDSHNFTCGVSMVFDKLDECSGYRKQAERSRELGSVLRPAQRVFFAGDMLPELILSMSVQSIGLEALILDDVKVLAKHDAEHNTQLLDTLEAYLEFWSRSSPAAAKLYIDRSTLSYRLKTISSMIRTDLNSDDAAIALLLGIKIYKLGELSPKQ